MVTRGVRCESRGGAAYLTLDRSAADNRFTYEMASAFIDACEWAEDAPDPVAVVQGRGPAFCAGLEDGVDTGMLRGRRDPVAALAAITKPVVAAVRGRAVGLGAELALAADLRIASRDAAFEFPDVSQGRVPCFGATQRLPRLVGRARALELLLFGTPITAVTAAKLGLVSRVVTSGRLDGAVRSLVAELGRKGPLALVLAKEAVQRAEDLTLADGLRLEEDLYVLLQTTDDRREGIRSFLEKRSARFRGR